MKFAISGKGGSGKTTLAALISQHYADMGRTVLALDADPSPCLAAALGFPRELRDKLRPVSEMKGLIEERTGVKPGTQGGFFKINPRVEDIPKRFSVVNRGVMLLEMGSVETGGTGCLCPQSTLIKTLFSHMIMSERDVLIMDMYAGVEHLGRATADFVDAMLIVAEPTRRSVETALQIKSLASDIGISRVFLVGNRISCDSDVDFLEKSAPDIPLVGNMPVDPGLLEADRLGVAIFDKAPAVSKAVKELIAALEENILERLSENSIQTPE